jgi:DNA-binding NtrC family response regulator
MKIIFVLDANADRQIQLNQVLTAMGYDVHCFSSASALEGVNDKPLAVILDESMGSFKTVREKMSGVPIVYTMASTDEMRVTVAMKMGAFAVIEKNSAEFVNLRTAIDKIVNEPPKLGWFSKLFQKKDSDTFPALSV